MRAEWLGGPDDGQVLALPDDTRWVTTAQVPMQVWAQYHEADDVTPIEVATKEHYLFQREGKWYIRW